MLLPPGTSFHASEMRVPDFPSLWTPELDFLNFFLASPEGSHSSDTPLRPMEGRGALGPYWLSRNDVTFR